jgi:predicted N-acyltransferase
MIPELRLRVVRRLSEVSPQAWNAIANPPGAVFDPFISWEFLEALERSGCAVEDTGWAPHHLLAEDGDGVLVGAVAAYAKSHSYGEYVFDHGWADAFRRAGGRYYPKLQAATPFTPVTGRRLLVAPGWDQGRMQAFLAAGLNALCDSLEASSIHVTFCSEAEQSLLAEAGYLKRTDRQFHWTNAGYRTFDDFLAVLNSEKRRHLRKEREKAQAGLEIVRLSGDAIADCHWDAFYQFYLDTGARKWGSPYLNREFFHLLHERLRDRVLLVLARRPGGAWIAGALNLIGSHTLFGRHWGCVEHIAFLHFELCYYQAIDHAIALGLARVEAGAQGEHKLARGYLPRTTYSAHWIAHPGLRAAVARFLEHERDVVEEEMDVLSQHAPFKRV